MNGMFNDIFSWSSFVFILFANFCLIAPKHLPFLALNWRSKSFLRIFMYKCRAAYCHEWKKNRFFVIHLFFPLDFFFFLIWMRWHHLQCSLINIQSCSQKKLFFSFVVMLNVICFIDKPLWYRPKIDGNVNNMMQRTLLISSFFLFVILIWLQS